MVDVQERPADTTAEAMALAYEVEQFLYREAGLLDSWRLPEWLELFATNGVYLIPATDKPDGDPARDLFLVQDDRFLLEQRINSLMRRAAHAEYPHSRTRRLISNVMVTQGADGQLHIAANFAVFRMRSGTVDTYVGHYDHTVERDDEGEFRFLVRRSTLDLDALRPHGKVSIIL
ncbi:aromatic-ring-hydroxylating dioxygenase subunit beta [Prescottella agglutinans]|jgi:p-cumate 2,3-dioxygenase beta subunit|uniref:p-cumate 2,3-dioxygenase beta subunit n=1 Tax=Prescottella agglutinans TaxID=1644129 RepID=A0ABT6MIL0_9NOCA|nr:aromatic-ring-hydroxylating dioxygenase subunit beta [Prescottella agglutinans]MDH6284156.1 p-cumate 2,3-dioxygenase beta subunit [Prescottella agglutinans]